MMKFQESLRIILTIAGKDIRDLFRNRILITILLGIGMMMALSKSVVLLAGGSQKPILAVSIETGNTLVENLAIQEDFMVIRVSSEARLTEMIAESRELILGIVLTEDFGKKLDASRNGNTDQIELAAYTPYWASDVKREKAINFFETRLSDLLQTQISLEPKGNQVYPDRNSHGEPYKAAIYLTIGVLLSAAATAPFLMVEEKQSKTLDSLLVSPANYTQIITAKFFTGLVPGLIGGLLIMSVYHHRISHWLFAFLMLLIGNAMIVLIGLWIGLITNHPVNLSLFLLTVLILLITPVLVEPSLPSGWPALARGIVYYFPSAGFSRLMRDAFTARIAFKAALPDLVSLAGCSALFFGLLVRKLSRLDR